MKREPRSREGLPIGTGDFSRIIVQVTTGQGLQLKKTVVDRDDQSGEEVLNGRFSVRTFLVLGIYVFSVEVLELGVSTFSLRGQKNPTQQCGEWINDTTQPDLPRPGKKRANPFYK